MTQPTDLFSAAMSGSTVRRDADMVIIIMPNLGVATTAQDLLAMRTWGRSRLATGNLHKDRMALLDRLETVIPHTQCGIAARGAHRIMVELVKAMKGAGFDLQSWAIPQPVMDEIFT